MARSKQFEKKGKAAVSNKRRKSNCHPCLTFKEAGAITTTSGRISHGNKRTRIITSMRSYIDEYGIVQKSVKLYWMITCKATVLFDRLAESTSDIDLCDSPDLSSYNPNSDDSADLSAPESTPCPVPRLPAPFPMQLDDDDNDDDDSVHIVKKWVKLPGFRTIDEFFLPDTSKNSKSSARTAIRCQIFVDSDIPISPVASGSGAPSAANNVIDVDADDEA